MGNQPRLDVLDVLNDVDAGAYGFREFIGLACYALAGIHSLFVRKATLVKRLVVKSPYGRDSSSERCPPG